MRVVVVGLGVQGHKRMRVAGDDLVATVDPQRGEAQFKAIADVPLASFDAALVCVPNEAKIEIVDYLAGHGKHVLVEKPLTATKDRLTALTEKARQAKSVCYTAYNHRFEPHYIRMRDLIASGELGKIYRCRMFYGNGTARLVRDSAWRDHGSGVLGDLGSHLLDTMVFWFGPEAIGEMSLISAERFENAAPDHVVIGATGSQPACELEMSLLMWRNHFTCDVLAERGSAHITSLCKWGPATFVKRTRILPSGRPPEESVTLVRDDPTWQAEYDHFKALVEAGQPTDLSRDMLLSDVLSRLADEADAVGQAGG